jgi:hypothetical protein
MIRRRMIRLHKKCWSHRTGASTAKPIECFECRELNNICHICLGRGCYDECLISCAEEEE